MKTIDLFCGCGGLSLGFQKAGFNIIEAYDFWDKAVDIYKNNFNHKCIQMDCNEISIDHLLSLKIDLIIGGAPCQDYSSAGKRNEKQGRAILTETFTKMVCDVKPKWFVMENVDRILKSETLPKCITLFKKNNYGLTQVVLDASYYGVPQKRKRYFLIGKLNGSDDFIARQIKECSSNKPMTIRDYLGDELETEHYYRHPRSYKRRGIFSIDEPSPTIRGINRPIPPTYQIHSGDTTNDLSKVKVLSSFERARLQTFPKSFVWQGTKTNLEQIIGNAVPVNLSQTVAECLMNYIKTS
ncbi:DNA (cytosine-5-)-methyltransferase [Candidatus Epulonipiscium fishelsonii]|uniref:DNA (Cytosine-5-)-methyltransferase n=1 Tax=Candidatus Epulonipiscium fishelsonii TaxID=77094 RepID=A0ACC8XBU0_9FIRM|nr:DNA (cytosine-5-)-methyltransferase [Epulopiscium sp. SCG-B05WGA-EpuloA1]ONI40034.1 DNA (cytosine-5-)-methyltransferase [Epulopiscium sp. SCG-B11WGA-EpuloA1]